MGKIRSKTPENLETISGLQNAFTDLGRCQCQEKKEVVQRLPMLVAGFFDL